MMKTQDSEGFNKNDMTDAYLLYVSVMNCEELRKKVDDLTVQLADQNTQYDIAMKYYARFREEVQVERHQNDMLQIKYDDLLDKYTQLVKDVKYHVRRLGNAIEE